MTFHSGCPCAIARVFLRRRAADHRIRRQLYLTYALGVTTEPAAGVDSAYAAHRQKGSNGSRRQRNGRPHDRVLLAVDRLLHLRGDLGWDSRHIVSVLRVFAAFAITSLSSLPSITVGQPGMISPHRNSLDMLPFLS